MTAILGVHHVQITVPSAQVEAERRFYVDLLGLAEIPKPDSLRARGGFWVRVGGGELHVSPEDDVARHATKAHVAYLVDDLESWKQRLTEQGFHTEMGVPIPGYTRCELRDPFGNRVELIQRLTAP
jgi:catechol 2,3-dioxygenase-like lactoylglutathione lyase family enzyme